MWNAVMVYNLWVMENMELIENGEKLTKKYSCCETASLQEIDEEKKLRKSRKYPTWSRVTTTMPTRKWIPEPVETLRALRDSIKAILVNVAKDWILTGYDPPLSKRKKDTSS